MKPKQIRNIVIGVMAVLLLLSILFFVRIIQTGYLQSMSQGQYFGRITSVGEAGITISERNGREIGINITFNTVIREGRRPAPASSLHIGDNIFVVGHLSADGEVEARVVRIFPAKQKR